MRRSLFVIACAVSMTLGCDRVYVARDGRPCSSGACVDGWVCNPLNSTCVQEVRVACDGTGLCPSEINAGTSCEPIGIFVPCVDGTAGCTSGCRICADPGIWGECVIPAADCRGSDACLAGQVCSRGSCKTVCTDDDSCGPGYSCGDGLCAPGRLPRITAVDSTGPLDGATGHAGHHLTTHLIVDGENLDGASFTLESGGTTYSATVCRTSRIRATVAIPENMPAGTFTLTATNQAGSCSVDLPILQGIAGPQGPTGPQGPDGQQGLVGPPGPSGPDFPSGAVMMFDLSACPVGWSPLPEAEGRYLVAAPIGGTLKGQVGVPMFDLEDRGHVHTSPAHGHNVSLNTSPHNRYDVAGATCCGYTERYVEDTMADEARGTRHTHSVVGGVSNAAPATDASPASAVAPYVQFLVCCKD